MDNTNQLSQTNVEEELDAFISSKNLELYELIHKKGVPSIYEGLDPRLKSVYKRDALKQFVKNRTKRCSSNSNEKDPLKKSIPRISKAQLLVWELLKQVGKTYDDIFSEWCEADSLAQKAQAAVPSRADELERIEAKIDYLVEKLAVHDRVPLKKKYSNLYELTTYLSSLVRTTDSTPNWTEETFVLYIYYRAFNIFLEKLSRKNDICKKYSELYSNTNRFNAYTLYIIYSLFLITLFFNTITDYTDSYKTRFNENDKVFEFETATDTEEFRTQITNYKKTILKFICEIKDSGITFDAKDCESLYGIFKALFENATDLFKDTDGNPAGSKTFRKDLQDAIFLRKQITEQYFLRIYISEEKKRQIKAVMEWREKIIQEVF